MVLINREGACDARTLKFPHAFRCFCCLRDLWARFSSRSTFEESHSSSMAGGNNASVSPSAAIKVFSAGTAGCVADLVTFPLDTAKVRLQVRVNRVSRTGTTNALRWGLVLCPVSCFHCATTSKKSDCMTPSTGTHFKTKRH